VKIISGKWEGKTGPIYARTPSYYFDVHLLPGGIFELPIPGEWNSIIFVHEGAVHYQDKELVDHMYCCKLHKTGTKDEFVHRFTSEKGARFVLIGGQPLNEPIVQHGPFVMNTQ
jgi:redox-sensitive bicupin YhaK (pirin superfamily)